jgi:hypothetical protein
MLPRRAALHLARRAWREPALRSPAARCASADCVGLLAAAAFLLLPGAAHAQLELEGTWHVLVHYRDDNTSHPEQDRWSDRVWVFERKGERLEWVEYPIAVFEDETGRFERRASGQYARVLGAWQPNEAQLADIGDGLRVNTRGMKRKSLRGSDAGGWQSASRARAGSASTITYEENWSIQGLPRLPVFLQEDVLGSERSETLEGATRFETTAVSETGDLLEGRFERDGTRRGSFAARRAGAVGMLEEKSQSEIQAQGVRRGLATSRVLREEVRRDVGERLRQDGIVLSDAELDALVDEAIRLVESGAGEEALRAGIAEWLARRSPAGASSP